MLGQYTWLDWLLASGHECRVSTSNAVLDVFEPSASNTTRHTVIEDGIPQEKSEQKRLYSKRRLQQQRTDASSCVL